MGAPAAVCIGASAGGVTAIQNLLSALSPEFSLPLVVAQHISADAELNLELVFGLHFHNRAVEVLDKMRIEPGYAYFAPGGYHLLIERDLTFALTQEEPVNFARPSIDVLFESASWALGERAAGILLTGANADGAKGLASIERAGGLTVVQDPQEAEFPYMPRSALDVFQPTHVLKLDEIARFLTSLTDSRVSDE